MFQQLHVRTCCSGLGGVVVRRLLVVSVQTGEVGIPRSKYILKTLMFQDNQRFSTMYLDRELGKARRLHLRMSLSCIRL